MEYSGNRGKDREYWREVEDWNIVIMSETWLKKGGWERLRGGCRGTINGRCSWLVGRIRTLVGDFKARTGKLG